MSHLRLLGFLVLVAAGLASCNRYYEWGPSWGQQFVHAPAFGYHITGIPAYDGLESLPFHRRLGSNLFEVEVRGLEPYLEYQAREDFCWAAAVSSLFNFNGIPTTQCEVVTLAHGSCEGLQSHAATRGEIVSALNGWRVNSGGGWSTVSASSFSDVPYGLVQSLGTNWPALVALKPRFDGESGHVYLLTRIRYSWVQNAYGVAAPAYWEVELFDPWEPSGGFLVLDIEDFDAQFDFAVQLRAQHY